MKGIVPRVKSEALLPTSLLQQSYAQRSISENNILREGCRALLSKGGMEAPKQTSKGPHKKACLSEVHSSEHPHEANAVISEHT